MTKLTTALVVLGAGLTLSACSLLPQRSAPVPADTNQIIDQTELTNDNFIVEEATDSALPSGTAKPLTLAEVALHSMPNDCWLVVEGNVYDVTAYIAAQKHPGGAAIIEGCGKEATELFMTRPMGSGTAHSSQAQTMLQQYYLGELVTTNEPNSSGSGDLSL